MAQPSDEWAMSDEEWSQILSNFDSVYDLDFYIESNQLITDHLVVAARRKLEMVSIYYINHFIKLL